MALFFVIVFVPPFLYRWALKSTFFVYLPLVWIVTSAGKQLPDLKVRLRRIREGEFSQLGRSVAAIVILGLATKIILMTFLAGFANWWNETPLREFFAIYVRPTEIPVWQLASFANGTLAFILYWFSAYVLERQGASDEISADHVEVVLRSASIIRTFLGLYTVGCTLYITVVEAIDLQLPQIGDKLFPWF